MRRAACVVLVTVLVSVAVPALADEVVRLRVEDTIQPASQQYIERVLQRTGWNVAAAARLLEIQRTYLHQKLVALGSQRPGTESQSS